MRPVHVYAVSPALPPALEPLRELAYNLHWAWDHDAVDLFRRLDRVLWESTGHNPVRLLGAIRQERLLEAAADDAFLASLDRVYKSFRAYMDAPQPAANAHAFARGPIAYFSAEFGITECLPIYSGGLGVLSGDHLKAASDLRLPLVGVGLLYQKGYFRQLLNSDGYQSEQYPDNDFYNLPLIPELDPAGRPRLIQVEFPGRTCWARVWRAQVGRVPLYMLDTNLPENTPADRDVTDYLYGGDRDMRIRQEILLGIGGLRALQALGIEPSVLHMNEGHSAFVGLERIRQLIAEHELSFDEARQVASAGIVFTTHTPVPAGIDLFSADLVETYFGRYREELQLSREAFLGLGRLEGAGPDEPFSMAILALRLSGARNGVSQLHGEVSRRLWQSVWPGLPQQEVPIGSVTNAVHHLTWVSQEMAELYDRYLGPGWRTSPADPKSWEGVQDIPAEELWRIHERCRERLVGFARSRLRSQLGRRGAPPREIEAAAEVLDPEALTIGFARRFATYKRAGLLFHDLDRLTRLLNDRERPVQLIFAGKAHPADLPGKEVIRQIVHAARAEQLSRQIVFIEDYDLTVARALVHGVDLWLTTPRRPLEASGTSGMKVAFNGGLNMSVLDGWWVEGYRPDVGWAIGRGEEYSDEQLQDEVESRALYNLLEHEVIPLFYERGRDGLPRGWIAKMKAAVRHLCPIFNTDRMLREYLGQYYLPAAQRAAALSANNFAVARDLAAWENRVRAHWPGVRVEAVQVPSRDGLHVGDQMPVTAYVRLGDLRPEDVAVELYYGPLNTDQEIQNGTVQPISCLDSPEPGLYRYGGSVPLQSSGLHGLAVRVLPRHSALAVPYDTRLLTWSS